MAPSPARVALLGDSVAEGVAPALTAEAARRGITVRTHTRVGCGITDGVVVGTNNPAFSARCAATNDAFLAEAAAAEPVDAVIVMSSWEVNSHVVDGRLLEFRSPEWDAWMSGQLDGIRARFGDVPVLLATVAPRAPLGPVPTMSPAEAGEVVRFDDFLLDHARWRGGESAIVDVHRILCPTDPLQCPEFIDGVRLRPGLGAHFDDAGAAWLAPRMLDAVQQAWEQVGAVVTAPPGF